MSRFRRPLSTCAPPPAGPNVAGLARVAKFDAELDLLRARFVERSGMTVKQGLTRTLISWDRHVAVTIQSAELATARARIGAQQGTWMLDSLLREAAEGLLHARRTLDTAPSKAAGQEVA